MTRVAVITGIYGGYDQPTPPVVQTVPVEWLLVSDVHTLCPPWYSVADPQPGVHPRLAAKKPKCRPDLYTGAEVTIWVDGHLHIKHPAFVRWCLDALGHHQIAQMFHPQRQSITQEAALSAQLPKYAGQPVAEQVSHYLTEGYPDDWGLWATGLIVRRNTGAIRMMGAAWLAEQTQWTVQDQLSEAPVLWRLGLRPATLDGPLLGHWAFDLVKHQDGTL